MVVLLLGHDCVNTNYFAVIGWNGDDEGSCPRDMDRRDSHRSDARQLGMMCLVPRPTDGSKVREAIEDIICPIKDKKLRTHPQKHMQFQGRDGNVPLQFVKWDMNSSNHRDVPVG
jgi:hypothetical protein